jgi:hypothetical protein
LGGLHGHTGRQGKPHNKTRHPWFKNPLQHMYSWLS